MDIDFYTHSDNIKACSSCHMAKKYDGFCDNCKHVTFDDFNQLTNAHMILHRSGGRLTAKILNLKNDAKFVGVWTDLAKHLPVESALQATELMLQNYSFAFIKAMLPIKSRVLRGITIKYTDKLLTGQHLHL